MIYLFTDYEALEEAEINKLYNPLPDFRKKKRILALELPLKKAVRKSLFEKLQQRKRKSKGWAICWQAILLRRLR